MAVTKSEGDGEHPASHYLVVEDPEKPTTWHLRVKGTDGKPDHGLMGAAAAALGKGYRGNKYEGPGKAEAISKLKALYKSEDMTYPGESDSASHSETVIRRGPIFKLGTYPDKQFALNQAEAARAVANFTPVPIDSEHNESIFDGQLGQLERVELKGDTIHGEMAVPVWLHQLFKDTPIPVSATWSRADKRIVGLALAKNPRVSEAAMMTALFAARHDTYEGQGAHQQIHDIAARGGAICNMPVGMVSSHEASGLQQIHDAAVEHGAQCSSVRPSMFAGRRHSESDQGAINRAHDAIVQAGADCPAPMSRGGAMNWKDFWAGFFGASGPMDSEMEAAAFTVDPSPASPPAAPVPAVVTPDPAIVQLQQELARLKAERIDAGAAAFADRQIANRKALPAERAALIAAFTLSATDDAAHGVVTFADGTTRSRVESLEAIFTARPAHALDTELVKSGDLAILSLDRQPAANSPQRRDQLLGMTEAGRAVIKARGNN